MIMVVEDDQSIQSIVEETLTDGGFEPAIAASGEKAVTLLQGSKGKYRALVTDINLRGSMDGWEVAKRAVVFRGSKLKHLQRGSKMRFPPITVARRGNGFRSSALCGRQVLKLLKKPDFSRRDIARSCRSNRDAVYGVEIEPVAPVIHRLDLSPGVNFVPGVNLGERSILPMSIFPRSLGNARVAHDRHRELTEDAREAPTGSYKRIIRMNSPSGVGSQLVCLSAPGDSF
jgi:hypothetical protein